MKHLYITFFWLALAFVIVLFSLKVYAETRPPVWPLGYNHWFVDMQWKWPSYDEHQKLVNPPQIPEVKKPIHQVAVVSKEIPVVREERTSPKDFDINKLAYAIAMAETWNCTKGYWVTHSNCHWIKSGNTYPCKTKPWSKMCIFKDKDESYLAFRTIWMKWYKTFPTAVQASRWTWADASISWRKNVSHYYSK